jgi:ABC-2 type transport system permease protein
LGVGPGSSASVSATSSALGITLMEIGSLAAVVTGRQLPLTLLSGVLLPLSLGPGWLQGLGHVNQMYYAVEAARDLAAGTIVSATVGEGHLIMGAAVAAALWWAPTATAGPWRSRIPESMPEPATRPVDV